MNLKRLAFIAVFALIGGMIFAEQAAPKPKRCVLTLELSQSHFSLSIGTHLKDAMNKATFDIPVDREFFDQVKVGDVLTKEFRTGSFILYGSFGDWVVKVKNKMEK